MMSRMNEITKVYISPFTNIFQNLCLEDFFLRNSDEEFVLFYSNEPCVVMGNFQNPWKETNPNFLSDQQVSLARRQSGGGTVFHDEGNLNFCVFRNKNIFSEADKDLHLGMIRKTIEKQNIVTDKLPKSGMVFLKDDVRYKFSGEAFKQTNKRSYHHGTLLINSDLELLQNCLIPALEKIKTNAVASNPHKVGNLSLVWSGVTPLGFIEAFNKINKLEAYDVDYMQVHRFVTENATDWASKEKVISKTPEFDVTIGSKKYSVKNAQVIAVDDVAVEPRDFSAEFF